MTDIIDIVREVVATVAADVTIYQSDGQGLSVKHDNPEINYIFGSSQYIKDMLDITSRSVPKTSRGTKDVASGEVAKKFPLVALFVPFTEKHDSADCYCHANISLLIACSSRKEWSNEKRKETSFENILKPIYERLMKALGESAWIESSYTGLFEHEKIDNYSYGRYGAYTESGDSVSEPIDAIVIRNLKLTIKEETCKRTPKYENNKELSCR